MKTSSLADSFHPRCRIRRQVVDTPTQVYISLVCTALTPKTVHHSLLEISRILRGLLCHRLLPLLFCRRRSIYRRLRPMLLFLQRKSLEVLHSDRTTECCVGRGVCSHSTRGDLLAPAGCNEVSAVSDVVGDRLAFFVDPNDVRRPFLVRLTFPPRFLSIGDLRGNLRHWVVSRARQRGLR